MAEELQKQIDEKKRKQDAEKERDRLMEMKDEQRLRNELQEHNARVNALEFQQPF